MFLVRLNCIICSCWHFGDELSGFSLGSCTIFYIKEYCLCVLLEL